MSQIYPHNVTIWNKLPERDGHARYGHAVLFGVRCEDVVGASRSSNGDAPKDTMLVLIPASVTGYIKPCDFYGAGWTLREHDLIADGVWHELEPVASAHSITTASPVRVGAKLDHWEVSGR